MCIGGLRSKFSCVFEKNQPATPMCKPSRAKAETDEYAGLGTMALWQVDDRTDTSLLGCSTIKLSILHVVGVIYTY